MDITRDMEFMGFRAWEQEDDRKEAERLYPYTPVSAFYGFSDGAEQAISDDRSLTNALREAFVAGRASLRIQMRPSSHGG